MFEFPHILAA